MKPIVCSVLLALLAGCSSDPNQASVDKLCKNYSMEELEHGEWITKQFSETFYPDRGYVADRYLVRKARVKRTILGTPTCQVGGFIIDVNKGNVYFLPESELAEFLKGNLTVLPQVEEVRL